MNKLKINFRTQMRKAKLKNLSDISYESKIQLRDLDRLFKEKLDGKNLNTLERLSNFFGCKMSSLLSDGMIWTFKGTAYDSISGIVYFIKNKETNLIKIGFTKDLLGRVSGLTTEFKAEMEVIHYISSYDAEGLEGFIHNLFFDKRISGEWFDLTEEDINKIKGENKKSTAANSGK